MKIAFVNYTPLSYSVNTPYQEPLGGSESALCYLAEALAKRGHQIYLFSNYEKKIIIRGVIHLPHRKIPIKVLRSLDTLVIQNTPLYAQELVLQLKHKTKLVLWLEHASDQPVVACLKEAKLVSLFQAFVFVSQWQRQGFLKTFALDPSRCFILRNAVSPAFERLFLDGEQICPKKLNPPVIAYTSTPFRGLDRLLNIFPAIKRVVPEVKLEVFSSMKVYQEKPEKELYDYGELYLKCRKTDGVNLIGSLSQTELAYRLKPALLLAYPNTFAETSSIAVMEAMAAGLYVITSNLGALPETTAGFGQLINHHLPEDEYDQKFTEAVIKTLKDFSSGNSQILDDLLVRQVYFTNQAYTWQKRSEEWEFFLTRFVLNL